MQKINALVLMIIKIKVTGRFGPIPVRTPGHFGPIPFRSGSFGLGPFGPISGVGRFGPIWRVISAHFILN